jgi:hypothetical protein
MILGTEILERKAMSHFHRKFPKNALKNSSFWLAGLWPLHGQIIQGIRSSAAFFEDDLSTFLLRSLNILSSR